MNNLVDTLFKQYIERVYKEQLPLPEVQIKELRRCFFAATWAMIHETGTIASTLSDEAAAVMLKSITNECEREAKDVLDKWYKSN